MNRVGRIAEWTGGRENARTKRGYERKKSIETGKRGGGREGGRGAGGQEEKEKEEGERVQRGHSSHDIKRGCRPLETRPTDSKDPGRSAMKSSLTRNCKKIGKN